MAEPFAAGAQVHSNISHANLTMTVGESITIIPASGATCATSCLKKLAGVHEHCKVTAGNRHKFLLWGLDGFKSMSGQASWAW